MTETAPASGRSIDATTTAILLIAAAAAALAVAARWGHDFSVDEPFTLLTIEHWRSTLRASLVHDNTPLTYVLLIGWRRVFGGSALALRSPFILAFAAAVVVAGLTARRLAGGGAGVLAAVMVASSVRIGLFHAATIRPYALLALLTSMALALTVGIHGAGGRRRLALMPGLAAVCLAGLLTHATFVFVIGALLTTVLLPGAPRAAVIMPVLAAGALFGVAWGPVVVATAALPATAWIPKPSVDALFAGYSMLWGPRNGYMLAGAVLAVALVDPRSARRVAADRPFVAVALAAVFLLVAPVLVSLVRPVFVPARTPILALPALAIAGSVLLQKLGSTPLRWVLGLMLAFSAARTVVDVYRAGDPAPTTRHLSRLLSELKCGDTIVASGLSYAPAAYAWRRLEAPACIELVPFPREVQEHPGWIDPMMADRQRASLEREAEALALARRGGGRLAVLAATRGVGRDVSAVLLDGLNRNFTLESSTSRPGTFFDSVVIYRPSIK